MKRNPSEDLNILTALFQKGEIDQAISFCQTVLNVNDQAFEIKIFLGFLYLEKKQAENAILAFKETLSPQVKDPRVFQYIAQAYLMLENWHEVNVWELKYLTFFPKDTQTLIRLSENSLLLLNHDASVNYLEQVLDIDPKHQLAHMKLALYYNKQLAWEKALHHYRQCLSGPDLLFKELETLFIREQFIEMEKGLTKALTKYPNHLELLFLKARLHLQNREWESSHALTVDIYHKKQKYLIEQAMQRVHQPVRIFPYAFEHQLAQLTYLLSTNSLPPEFEKLRKSWAETHQMIKGKPLFELTEISCLGSAFLSHHYYSFPLPEFETVLNPELDILALENAYFNNGYVVIDHLLKPEVLEALYEYCLRSTIWHQASGTTLGSSSYKGLHPKIMYQLSHELQTHFPRVFNPHSLTNMWAIKRDSRGAGTRVHGDEAIVNFNFWITPSESNLDPSTGGLVVYTQPAPSDWAFSHYDFQSQAPKVEEFLKSSESKSQHIPYRPNRAVVFKGDFYHETDRMHFKPGFINQRLVFVMLYGTRSVSVKDSNSNL